MNSFDSLLQEIIAEARALRIPVSPLIDPHITVNRRAKKRLGCCIHSGLSDRIELSARLLDCDESLCRQTIAHEVLHTCFGCRNHGKRWKAYAERMNKAYGYNIKRLDDSKELAEKTRDAAKHLIICESCGAEIIRLRASNLTKHPERYRCRCGGKLRLVY